MLNLADQCHELDYRDAEDRAEATRQLGLMMHCIRVLSDGTRVTRREFPERTLHAPQPAEPPSNIAPAHGMGRAYASDDAVNVMQKLDLIVNQTWTAAAELVFWRIQPSLWAMNIQTDPRFISAVSWACDTLPADLRGEFDCLQMVGDDLSRQTAFRKQLYHLDWQFGRRWRSAEGWLSQRDASLTLDLSPDDLAISMRQAVMAKLYPSLGSMRQGQSPVGQG